MGVAPHRGSRRGESRPCCRSGSAFHRALVDGPEDLGLVSELLPHPVGCGLVRKYLHHIDTGALVPGSHDVDHGTQESPSLPHLNPAGTRRLRHSAACHLRGAERRRGPDGLNGSPRPRGGRRRWPPPQAKPRHRPDHLHRPPPSSALPSTPFAAPRRPPARGRRPTHRGGQPATALRMAAAGQPDRRSRARCRPRTAGSPRLRLGPRIPRQRLSAESAPLTIVQMDEATEERGRAPRPRTPTVPVSRSLDDLVRRGRGARHVPPIAVDAGLGDRSHRFSAEEYFLVVDRG